MRKSNLSLITAAIVLVCAVVWLLMNNAARGVGWVAIALVWLVTAAIQRMRHDDIQQPHAGHRLLRRFSRLLLFWS
jgi:hypothetical protein